MPSINFLSNISLSSNSVFRKMEISIKILSAYPNGLPYINSNELAFCITLVLPSASYNLENKTIL